MSEPRYAPYEDEPLVVCEDCGVLVADQRVHARFHSILGSHAWALAVLKTAHIAAHVHDKYEVVERIDSRTFDNWSADALAEVMAERGMEPEPSPTWDHKWDCVHAPTEEGRE